MHITAIESTDLFIGSALAPRQIVRVSLRAEPVDLEAGGGEIRVALHGPAVTTPEPAVVPAPVEWKGEAGGKTCVAEVGVRIAEPVPEGGRRRVTAVAQAGDRRCTADGEVIAAATGWTMWMVSHFHYDPVWWNTQAGFTETWYDLPAAEGRRPPEVRTAFDLVRAHLDAARHDGDYKFVLAEVDYLKPYWDAFPEDRADLRRFLTEERVELVGGNYNEPNTNLTHPESTIRNAVHGIGYQRDVVGGDPRSAWMIDVFGHDPAYPGLMADAGLTSTAWARGPFHMWGPNRHVGDNERMQFPAEFEWISPSGRGLLTGYMANHYGAGWEMERAGNLPEAAEIAYGQFAELKPVAATRNVMLPVGADHVVPSRWCTEIHRDWNKRYVWPRFVVGLPRDFFGAVRAELGDGRRSLSPQTRDMNPVYTGKDVSYIDTKQAQRAAEVAVLDAERLVTLAALTGAVYPDEALDKAWRQLAFGAHHDAITGSESDQVYVDLLGSWREAYELGDEVRIAALDRLASLIDTTGPGRPVVVANTLSWRHDGITTVRLTWPADGPPGVRMLDDAGEPVPVLAEGVRRDQAGMLAEITLTFLARDVPSLGYRVYRVVDADADVEGWRPVPGSPTTPTVRNGAYEITVDPARGGALSSIRDLRTGRELLRSGRLGAEFVLQEEYPSHPVWGEGPWHLLPKGPGTSSAEGTATVRVEESPIGRRVVTETVLGELRITSETLVWEGIDRLDFRTHVDGSIGADHLLRVRFDLDVPGGRPVSEVGFAAIGRPFGFPDADTGHDDGRAGPAGAGTHLWTLDNPAHTWTALSATARIVLTADDGSQESHAIGVAEVVAPEVPGPEVATPEIVEPAAASASEAGVSAALGSDASVSEGRVSAARAWEALGEGAAVRGVLAALVAQGVTATSTRPDGPRYGALDLDSNLPDVRIVLGGPDENAFAAEVLATAGPAYAAALAGNGRVFVPPARPLAEVWGPGADLRGVRDLPVLIVTDPAALCADLGDARIEVRRPDGLEGTPDPVDDYSVALLNAGIPGTVAKTGEALYLNLMRACSTWPSGVWIDGPLRTAPDGSSLSWQHWSHTFCYALTAGEGDWRDAGFVRAGQEYNHELRTALATTHAGELPGTPTALVTVQPDNVLLSTLKPAGNPLASGRPGGCDPRDGVTVRVYESAGRPATARVGLFTGVAEAHATDLLESPGGRPLNPTEIELGAADVVTLRLLPAAGANRRAADAVRLGPSVEAVQPVFARYWLHNRGPAPIGNLPVAVHLSPQRLTGDGEVRLTVAASGRSAAGRVELEIPDGLTVAAADLGYDLAAGEHAGWELAVRTAQAPAGRYFLAARILDDLGQSVEDVVSVEIGEEGTAEPLEVSIVSESFERGERWGREQALRGRMYTKTIRVRVRNTSAAVVRGEAQLASPFGTWGPRADLIVGPPAQGFEVAGGEQTELDFTVDVPATARPGHWWALARVAAFGRLYYTETVSLSPTPPAAGRPR